MSTRMHDYLSMGYPCPPDCCDNSIEYATLREHSYHHVTADGWCPTCERFLWAIWRPRPKSDWKSGWSVLPTLGFVMYQAFAIPYILGDLWRDLVISHWQSYALIPLSLVFPLVHKILFNAGANGEMGRAE